MHVPPLHASARVWVAASKLAQESQWHTRALLITITSCLLLTLRMLHGCLPPRSRPSTVEARSSVIEARSSNAQYDRPTPGSQDPHTTSSVGTSSNAVRSLLGFSSQMGQLPPRINSVLGQAPQAEALVAMVSNLTAQQQAGAAVALHGAHGHHGHGHGHGHGHHGHGHGSMGGGVGGSSGRERDRDREASNLITVDPATGVVVMPASSNLGLTGSTGMATGSTDPSLSRTSGLIIGDRNTPPLGMGGTFGSSPPKDTAGGQVDSDGSSNVEATVAALSSNPGANGDEGSEGNGHSTQGDRLGTGSSGPSGRAGVSPARSLGGSRGPTVAQVAAAAAAAGAVGGHHEGGGGAEGMPPFFVGSLASMRASSMAMGRGSVDIGSEADIFRLLAQNNSHQLSPDEQALMAQFINLRCARKKRGVHFSWLGQVVGMAVHAVW